MIRSPSTTIVLMPSRVATGIGWAGSASPSSTRCWANSRIPLPHISLARAVAVAVVHEPLRAVGLARVEHRRPDHPQHAVAADAGAAVAQGPHPGRVQVAVHGAVVVGQQHEVVLGPVALEERVAVRVSHRDPSEYDGP